MIVIGERDALRAGTYSAPHPRLSATPAGTCHRPPLDVQQRAEAGRQKMLVELPAI